MRDNIWSPLASWLLSTYPDDVLMPVAKGSKAPLFPHINGQWSWAKYEAFVRRHHVAKFNIAILLKTLCVVDVDSHDLVEDLEARFPCLKTCPSEQTKKGAHFFFKRSALCDSAEFYDQRSTVISKVDFKTLCATGNASVILVGPSENKVWVRTPWSMGDVLPEIPDDLLTAVAIPMRKIANVTFTFPNGDDLVVINNPNIHKFGLIASVIDDDDDDAQEIPLQHGSAELMTELLFFLDNRRYNKWPVDSDGIERLADYMCGTQAVMRSLSTTNPASPTAWITAIDSVSSEWASTFVSGEIIDVSTSPPHIAYAPLHKDERWLFERSPHIDLPAGTPMLREDMLEYASRTLPVAVRMILETFPNVALAGSSVLDITCPHILTDPSDYDLYLFGIDTEEQAIAIIDGIKRLVRPETVTQTGAAITMIVDEDVIQIILRRYTDPRQIVTSFDVAPCQVVFHGGKVWATTSWVHSIKHMAMFVNFWSWTTASVSRVFKYYSKGYEVLVPGLRRDMFADADKQKQAEPGVKNLIAVERAHDEQAAYFSRYSPYDDFVRDEMAKIDTEYADLSCADRFEMAFKSLREIGESRAKKQRVEKRFTAAKMQMLVKNVNYWGARHESGYSEFLGADRLPWALRALVNSGLKWLGMRPVRGIEARPLTVPVATGEPFHTSPPNFTGLYDFNKI